MGAWIEMSLRAPPFVLILSLPTWERGLKFCMLSYFHKGVYVAPYMGAWIEIVVVSLRCYRCDVAPYMGAWIEILATMMLWRQLMVAPYMGAWIEIKLSFEA